MLASLDPASGKVSGAIEIRLKPDWTTYWRYPGSSGIPPVFDFSASKAFHAGEVGFPSPQLISKKFGSFAGYKKQVIFPFDGNLHSRETGELNLQMLIGVCADVCVPAKASMKIDAGELYVSDPVAQQVIGFAKQAVPQIINAKQIGFEVTMTDKERMHVTLKNQNFPDTPSLFAEGPQDWYLTPATLVSQHEGKALFELDLSRVPTGTEMLEDKLRFTLVTGNRGYEIRH